MSDGLAERLEKILVDQLNHSLEGNEITEDTSLYGKGLGLDSVDVVSLIVRIEDEFNVFFEADEVADSVATFRSLLRAIRVKMGGGATA
jgi:acyl carrier protein